MTKMKYLARKTIDLQNISFLSPFAMGDFLRGMNF